jgi:hypothetical protein
MDAEIPVIKSLKIRRLQCSFATTKESMERWIEIVKNWFQLKPRFIIMGQWIAVQLNQRSAIQEKRSIENLEDLIGPSIYFQIELNSNEDLSQKQQGLYQTHPGETTLLLTESVQYLVPTHLRLNPESLSLLLKNKVYFKIIK